MNFQNLLQTMKSLDEGSSNTVPETVSECGMPGMSDMPSGMAGMRGQQDSVTMNVSMNGSGAGGIRDLMSILKNIESHDGAEPHGDKPTDMIVGMEDESIDGGFGSATTSPEQEIAGIDAVTRTGNDMHSKGDEAEKVNGGGNPMGVDESLIRRLTAHYNDIKGE